MPVEFNVGWFRKSLINQRLKPEVLLYLASTHLQWLSSPFTIKFKI